MNSNDPLFGGIALWDVESEDDSLKFMENFNMPKFLDGNSNGDLSFLDDVNDDEVALASDFFKQKVEIVDQSVIVEKTSGNLVNSPKIESPNPTISVPTTPRDEMFSYAPQSSIEVPRVPYKQHAVVGKASKKQPRPYNLKTAEVKKNPVYQKKREKNNDAVRKCREKAKLEQKQKDDLLDFYYNENQQLKAENAELRQQLHFAALNCRCGTLEILGEE